MAVVGLVVVTPHNELRRPGYDRHLATETFFTVGASHRCIGFVVVLSDSQVCEALVEQSDPEVGEENSAGVSRPCDAEQPFVQPPQSHARCGLNRVYRARRMTLLPPHSMACEHRR